MVLDNLNWFTWDVVTLCGVFAVAFNLHAVIIPIMKNNKHQEHNLRDVGLGFGWTGIIYTLVGGFGAVAISGVPARSGTNG